MGSCVINYEFSLLFPLVLIAVYLIAAVPRPLGMAAMTHTAGLPPPHLEMVEEEKGELVILE